MIIMTFLYGIASLNHFDLCKTTNLHFLNFSPVASGVNTFI